MFRPAQAMVNKDTFHNQELQKVRSFDSQTKLHFIGLELAIDVCGRSNNKSDLAGAHGNENEAKIIKASKQTAPPVNTTSAIILQAKKMNRTKPRYAPDHDCANCRSQSS